MESLITIGLFFDDVRHDREIKTCNYSKQVAIYMQTFPLL